MTEQSDAGPRHESDAGPRNESDAGPRNESDAGPRNESGAGPRCRSDAESRGESDAGRRSSSNTRRRYLRHCAGVAGLAVTSALAGCPSPNESIFDQVDGITGESADGGSGDGGASEVPEVEPSAISREPDYGDWFDDVDNYQNGTVVYQARRETVTVTVGAAGNGGNLAFQQPAIAVSVGTTVEWEWATEDGEADGGEVDDDGEDGEHNVVAVDGTFDSGSPEATRSEPFSHRFTEAGTYRYACEPHDDDGMRGSVSVYDPDG